MYQNQNVYLSNRSNTAQRMGLSMFVGQNFFAETQQKNSACWRMLHTSCVSLTNLTHSFNAFLLQERNKLIVQTETQEYPEPSCASRHLHSHKYLIMLGLLSLEPTGTSLTYLSFFFFLFHSQRMGKVRPLRKQTKWFFKCNIHLFFHM